MKAVVKIRGYRGTWYADVEGHRLPVLHESWWRPPHQYFDPMIDVDLRGAKYQDLVQRLRTTDMAIIQRDKGPQLARDGYIGVFTFSDLKIGPNGEIALTLRERLASSDR